MKVSPPSSRAGLALITVLSLMSLLIVLLVGLLTLTMTDQAASSQSKYQAEAEANAKMALMIALGETQEVVGPDRRITAYATILDENADTPDIDGVNNARFMGAWDSWGAWLNADYQDATGATVSIADTYDKGRTKMFKRWLVSAPQESVADIEFAKSGDVSGTDYVTLLGEGSVGKPEDEVRAQLVDAGGASQIAWWVGGRNHGADIQVFGEKQSVTVGEAELASGDAGVRAVNTVPGYENLPTDEATLRKVIDHRQIELASVEREAMKNGFFDVVDGSSGVLADVRWGGLKKDLNLLFEQNALPSDLRRNAQTAPSPRPMSNDLQSYSPRLANRGFTSFELMRDYYRSYKSSGSTPLTWDGKSPKTNPYLGHAGDYGHVADQGYRRMPVIAKHYSVYSLLTTRSTQDNAPYQGDRAGTYQNDVVFSTVMVLWNPFNVPIEIPDNHLLTYTLPYKILPSAYVGYRDSSQLNANWIPLHQGANYNQMGRDFSVPISSGDGTSIRFEPGQFRIFSKKGLSGYGASAQAAALTPGYDPTGAFGQRMRTFSNKPAGDSGRWGVAVRLDPLWNSDGTAYWWGGSPGAFGNLIWNSSRNGNKTMGTMYDWTGSDYDYAEISGTKNNGAEVAMYDFNVRDTMQPFCVVGITLKSAFEIEYGSLYAAGMKDYRSKNWLQGLNSVGVQKMNVNYNSDDVREMQRLDSGYRLHFSDVTSINDVSKLFNVDSTNKLCSLGADEFLYSIASLEVPTVPITSVAGFAGMRTTPGWYQIPAEGGRMNASTRFKDNTEAYVSGVPGVGVGNSFAQPTIPGSSVYQYHDVSKLYPSSNSGLDKPAITDSNAFSDYWDHALLVNDGLWDSWFASGMVDSTRPSTADGVDLSERVTKFFDDGEELPYQGYERWNPGGDGTDVVTDTLAADGYRKVARQLKNAGAFNVNSTSVDAWFALFAGLEQRDATYREANGTLDSIDTPSGSVVLSRFVTAPGKDEVTDIRQGVSVNGIGNMWTGVRIINEDQLRKLAEECVKQVKLRGPFLNMSDFVNRRLATDDTGLSGALQAAIDYDDQNPDSQSINYQYKEAPDMIARNDSKTSVYPFQAAAGGSLFTGAPGYVVQSDLLRPLGNSLTVRDDTFVIRAYGESKGDNGQVNSRAWCEVVVQRVPDYVDQTNDPEEPVMSLDTSGNPTQNANLSIVNQKFGRNLKIVSFRWLDPEEV